MRIELGELRVQNYPSIYEIRRKLYRLFIKLTEDTLLATRISIAVSQVCKQLIIKGSKLSIALSLDSDMSGNIGFNFTFSDTQPLAEGFLLPAIFEYVRPQTILENKYYRQASLLLPLRKTPSKDIIWTLESIIQEKSRDELIDEIKATNEELKDSLENLRRTRSAKERMESELNIGREIQMSMLPLKFPPFPDRQEIDIFAVLHPAREVGGDFYDFFFIDEKRFCFCVGDVSGKGVPAALFMAMTKTLIKSRAADDCSTASIITHVNDELSEDNKTHMFVTIFICMLNIRTGELTFTNAGHNPPFIKRMNGSVKRLSNRHGPVVGALGGVAYKEEMVTLRPNDQIILYTDGVTEAMDENDKLYSESRLLGLLSGGSPKSVDKLVLAITDDVQGFEGEAEQADDVTILALQFIGESDEVPVLNIVIRNEIPEIDSVNEQFNEFTKGHDIEQGIRRKINLIFDELLSNIIKYAYPDQAEHKIEIKVELFENRLAISVIDNGIPFNPFGTEAPDIAAPLEERGIGGLGIHLVKNLMDKASYQRNINRNIVTLVKYLK